MIFEYIDDKNRGKLKAGMNREEVQKIFNSPIFEFKKSPFCEVTSDAFHELDIHAHYNQKTNKLEGIEIFQPNHLIYKNDVVLLERDLKFLLIDLKNKKIPFTTDCLGIDLEKGKLGVYVPHIDESCPECACVYVDLEGGCSLNILDK
ncbi:outer membrane protein assembly factor BamE [Silvanigrella aquatica]|uniref:Uncharacterized protein n=1 Tax=Silvanigrella aquatica TaxID=1915309 RepID=A0A1L4CY08_9BACT|nr:outer membrane protein assembly factor BamE [Silvanigrella aquatica]APJ02829.1 hypothetical protein AXG55_02395 [Silvanigrella aquatica]